jgi:Spy/CpxP family protein refolding chaperone
MTWLTNPMARLRAMGMAMLCATFVVGGLAGAAARQVVSAREPAAAAIPTASCERRDHADGRASGPPRDAASRPLLYHELDLTDAQRVRIDEILEARTSQIDALEPRMRAIVDSTRAEIHALLSPEQLDELRQLWRARREAERAAEPAREQPAGQREQS